jgi:putative transposase
MGHTYTKLITHIIFSTKDRTPLLTLDHRADIHDYLRGILRGIHCDTLAINGVADHVHAAVQIPPSLSVSEVIQTAKTNSSKWINDVRMFRCHFAWQRGFSAFSVSDSSVDKLLKYIANQEQHHRNVPFQEELLAFLKRYKIDYDERYIWT